jgi:hypothetical protein
MRLSSRRQRADSDPQARVPSVVRVTSAETTGRSAAVGTAYLTSGWEPDLADDDSICLRWLRHFSAQLAAFAEAAGGWVVRDERYLLADHGRPASFFNGAVLLAPWSDDAAFGAVVDEIEARTAGGAGAFSLWSIWPTPDLRARGWELDGHPPLLVRPPAPAVLDGPLPDPVRTAAELAAWERVVVRGYPMDDLQPFRPGTLAAPALLDDPRLRFWTSSEGGAPVTASAQFVAHGLAGFAMGVTLPAHRRAGHWARHVQLRLALEPDLWHVGVFSDHSRAGAERAGFTPVVRHTLWHRTR